MMAMAQVVMITPHAAAFADRSEGRDIGAGALGAPGNRSQIPRESWTVPRSAVCGSHLTWEEPPHVRPLAVAAAAAVPAAAELSSPPSWDQTVAR